MSVAEAAPRPGMSLSSPEFKAELQRLRQADNTTNWYYFLRTYLFLTLVAGGAVWFFESRAALGLSWWWNVPVAVWAVLCVGAGQHQLSALAHEAVHKSLFRNKWLNDLAGDLLCMFPMFSSLYHYRLQHWAHHQFVNDPERDPDISQLRQSGHWLRFPLPRREFLVALVKQLWLPNLVRFMKVRAKYSSTGDGKNPYMRPGETQAKLALRAGGLTIASVSATLAVGVWQGSVVLLAVVAPAIWLASMVTYAAVLPATAFQRSRVKPVVPPRVNGMLRVSFICGVFCGLAWLSHLGSPYAFGYFLLLWALPIFTTFSLYMILRQIVQHGNGGRGFLNNTRVFLVNRAVSYAVFPLGQDYHLPHHMYSTVPHYRLKELHELMLNTPEYAAEAVVVEGYLRPPVRPALNPTVLDVLEDGKEVSREVYIDQNVMGENDVDDLAAIRRQEDISRAAYQKT